jgi:hypothetical protein
MIAGTAQRNLGAGRAIRGASQFSGSGAVSRFPGSSPVCRRLAAFRNCLLVSVNSIFHDFSGGDLRDAHVSEEGDQVNARSPVLAVHIVLVPLPCVMMSYSCRYYAETSRKVFSALSSRVRSFPEAVDTNPRRFPWLWRGFLPSCLRGGSCLRNNSSIARRYWSDACRCKPCRQGSCVVPPSSSLFLSRAITRKSVIHVE